jgi:hypothetical protein
MSETFEKKLSANPKTIARYLHQLMQDWEEREVVELRFLAEKRMPENYRFETSQIREATNCILEMNNRGLNAYAVVHPVLRQTPVSAKDADIKRAFFAYVDADEKGAADRVRDSKLFVSEMEVVTGTKPFLRNHMYFRFDEPMTDMLRWSELQKCLIKEFGTDAAIYNPSRLMRIAGSVAYPSASKIKRHYRAEVTKLLMGGNYVE